MNLFKWGPVIFCTIVLFAACGGKDKKADNSSSEKLQGTWEIKRAEGTAASMNLGTVYEFSGNKLTLSTDLLTNPGVTEITDSTFSYKPDNNERKFLYNYHFNGDTLVAEIEISGGQTFYLARKQ